MSSRFAATAIVAALAQLVRAQEGGNDAPGNAVCSPAQIDHVFKYEDLPYKVGPNSLETAARRGMQSGYNRCNSTTEGPESMCQTAFINSIDDWCLWAPGEPGSMVGDVEGEMVAWCTKPGHGTRLIPAGAITGVQFVTAPAYVQISGFIDQTQINLAADDYGGEMDPHGADLCGNPMGGMVYSSAWGGSNGSQYTQVMEWHNFLGSGTFCFKACDPSGSDDAHYCEHIFDRIGCLYNAPSHAQNGTFDSCASDNQLFPGVYVEDGVTRTYTQPPESLGAITTIPYQPFVPSSSSCTTYSSASLFSALGTVSTSTTSSAPVSTSPPTSGSSTAAAGSRVSSGVANAAASASATTGTTSGASPAFKVATGFAGLVGAVAAIAFL